MAAFDNDDGREPAKQIVLTVFVTVYLSTREKIPNNVIAIAEPLMIEWE